MENRESGNENSSSNPKSFPFIVSTDQSKPDKKTRKLVKQHVMRDIAIARRKGNKKEKKQNIQIPLFVPELYDGDWLPHDPGSTIDNLELRTALERVSSPFVERLGAGRFDPFLPYPIEMDHTSRALIDNVFDTRVHNMKPYRDAFFHIAIRDQAAFLQLLANAELLRTLQNAHEPNAKVEITYTATKYHTKAINIANSRLHDSKDGISDGVISTVLIMAVYNHILQDFDSWNIHMNGLKRIVQLRGGIEALDTTPRLRLLISWHDVSGSYTLDQHPHFPFPTDSLPILPTPEFSPSAPIQHLLDNFSSSKQTAAFQTLSISHSYHEVLHRENNWPEGRIIADALVSGFWMNRLLQLLLCLNIPIESSKPLPETILGFETSTSELGVEVVRELWRLGALLYLAPVRRRMGVWPVRTDVYVRKVCQIFQRSDLASPLVLSEFGTLKLWVLVIALFEARNAEEKGMLLEILGNVSRYEGLESYEQVRGALGNMFWAEVHDEKLRGLWSQIGRRVG